MPHLNAVGAMPRCCWCLGRRPYVKSVFLGEDLVPRLNADSLASLQAELRQVDWRGQLQRNIEEHEYVQVSTSGTLRSELLCEQRQVGCRGQLQRNIEARICAGEH